MSHTVELDTEFKSPKAIAAVCKSLGLPMREITSHKPARLYSGSGYTEGVAIDLPRWRYPVVITPQGKMFYDNYGGQWGSESELHKFMSTYEIAVIRDQAKLNGYMRNETTLPDGTVRITMMR